MILIQHETLTELLREQIFLAYEQTEYKHKFKNKGLYFLLGLFHKDPAAILKARWQERSKMRK